MIKTFHVLNFLRSSKSPGQLNFLRDFRNFSQIKNPNKPSKPSLKEYQAIKNRQKSSISTQKSMIQKNWGSKQYNQQKQPHSHYKCDGCNTYLQFKDNKKYGFINQKVFKQAINQNKSLIDQTYGLRVSSGDAKVIDFLHEIQTQTNVQIFAGNKEQGLKLKNLDNVTVMLLLQEKIDKYQEENQTLKRSKKVRRQLFCYRCHSLKYHNHLPQQYDDQIYEGGLNLDREYVLQKVFSKHKSYHENIHFLFVVDALDIFGTLKKDLVLKLIQKGTSFSIVINKCDILNDKYLAQTLVHQQVKRLLREYIYDYEKSLTHHTTYINFSAQQKLKEIKVFFVSSVSRNGIKKIQEFMVQGTKRIQLFGVPNTGKTSLLNKLLRSDKITSKIPGTTIRVSEFTYRDKIKIFDMPGLHYPDLLYNLISKPSLKSLLTWSKFYSPPLMTHECFIYGGKIQAQGLRIIPFGLGGCCSSDNKWFILNYKQFWKGLPGLKQLRMVKHERTLVFKQGRAQDLQIAGYGFISFKPCIKTLKNYEKKITFYLPQKVAFHFRESVLRQDKIFHNRSAFTKRHQLERIQKESNALI